MLDLHSKALGYVQVVQTPAGEIEFIVGYSRWWGWQLVSLDMSPSEYAAAATWRDTEATPPPDDAIVRVALSRS